MWFCYYNSPHISVDRDLVEKGGNKVTDSTDAVTGTVGPFQWVILNSSNYVLPYVNHDNTWVCIGETFCKQIDEGQAGLSDCLGK